MNFTRLRNLLHRSYSPLNRVYISKSALLHNFEYLSSVNEKVKIAPVLKSNAYGHGLLSVAEILQETAAPFFCVDSLPEAYQLKKAGIKKPILIMGGVDPTSLKTRKLPFSFSVHNLQMAEALDRYQPGAKVHLFIDTGMHREGVLLEQLPEFLETFKKLNLKLTGVMSHFASADEPTKPQTNRQIDQFNAAIDFIESAGFTPDWIHISASAGLLTTKNLRCNLARTGKAIYGISPLTALNPNLKPVMKLTSKIADIKTLHPGDQVGYGGTFTATKPMTIGVLPIGYNDGVDRRLSNRGVVQVDGINCQILGLVSMNLTVIDLTKVDKPQLGQEVVVYSNDPEAKNSIKASAKLAYTIAYDFLVHINPTNIRREIVD